MDPPAVIEEGSIPIGAETPARCSRGGPSAERPDDYLVGRTIARTVRCPRPLAPDPLASGLAECPPPGWIVDESLNGVRETTGIAGRCDRAARRRIDDLAQCGQVADEDRDAESHRLVRLEGRDEPGGTLVDPGV